MKANIIRQFQAITDFLFLKESEILQKEGLRFRQFEYLKTIQENENCTVTSLSNKFKIKKPTATIALNDLIQKGLVRKVQNKKDKRFFYLRVTSKGKRAIEKIEGKREKILFKLLEGLSTKDLKNLSWTLNKILTEIELEN